MRRYRKHLTVALALCMVFTLLQGLVLPGGVARAADDPVKGKDLIGIGGPGNQTRLVEFDEPIEPDDDGIIAWHVKVTPEAPTGADEYTLIIQLLPTTYTAGGFTSGTLGSVHLRLRGAQKDFFWYRGGGGASVPGATWAYGSTYDIEIRVNVDTQQYKVLVSHGGTLLGESPWGAFTDGTLGMTEGGAGFFGLAHNTGTSSVGSYLPGHWGDDGPDDPDEPDDPEDMITIGPGQTQLIPFTPALVPEDAANIVTYKALIRPESAAGTGDFMFYLYLLPQEYPESSVTTGTQSPIILRFRDIASGRDFHWYRGGGAGNPGGSGAWNYGDRIEVEIKVNIVTQQTSVSLYRSDGSLIGSQGMQTFTYNKYPFTANGIGFLGIAQVHGTTSVLKYLPEHWADPEPPVDEDDEDDGIPEFDNGDYYIRSPRVSTFHSMAFEINKPLKGTIRNELSFKLKVDEAGSTGFIAFLPRDRVVTGGNTRPMAIQISPDNKFLIRNGAGYVDSGVSYVPGQEYAFDVEFDFKNFKYSVQIDGTLVAEDYDYTRGTGGDIKSDGENRGFGTDPKNVGIISVCSPNSGGFDMYDISVGINNLVDNDALRNTAEVNPVTNGDGSKTYFVGPQRKFQKPQDVIVLLEPGDTVQIEGDQEYPAPLHIQTANGAKDGTADKPIEVKGIKVNGKYPVLRSAGALNVVDVSASNWVLDGLVIQGHLQRACEVRGQDYNAITGFEPSWISYRGIYFSGGNNLVVRNCEVFDSYQGIHCSGSNGDLLVEYSNIYRNGTDGYGHGLYLASVPGATARIQFNYIHDMVASNNGLKSRMGRNEVYFNYFKNNAQAIELLGTTGSEAPRDSDVVGNVIISTNPSRVNGMRIGGDGTGPGSYGRYRIANNTFAMLHSSSAYMIRTFTMLESMEVYNNVFYAQSPDSGMNLVTHISPTTWVSGAPRIAGANNWVRQGSYNPATLPAEWTGTLLGDDPGFADIAALDFTLLADSPLIGAGVPIDTLEEWEPFPGMRDQTTFIDPLLALDFHPLDPATMSAAARVYKALPDIGAYAYDDSIDYDDLEISSVKNGNGQADINFKIWSANGKGYTLYLSATGQAGSFVEYKNVNYNSKGAHVKKLTNGQTYYAYLEYSGHVLQRSGVVVLKPSK